LLRVNVEGEFGVKDFIAILLAGSSATMPTN
jgi:hypothetical protein